MLDHLKRLVTTGAAYQFGDILAKGLALLTLPLYTHHLNPEAYGAAETLLTAVILSSILLRVGVGEAFIRFYFDDDDHERRDADRAHGDGDGRVDDDARGARWRSLLAGPLSRSCSTSTTRCCSTAPCSGCGRSRTSRWPTRSCAWTSARAPTCTRRARTWR